MRVFLSFVFICVLVPVLMAQTADPNYRALREAAPAESFVVENIDLVRDETPLPKWMMSFSCRRHEPVTRWRLTKVPLVLPRSVRRSRPVLSSAVRLARRRLKG